MVNIGTGHEKGKKQDNNTTFTSYTSINSFMFLYYTCTRIDFTVKKS